MPALPTPAGIGTHDSGGEPIMGGRVHPTRSRSRGRKRRLWAEVRVRAEDRSTEIRSV